MNDQKPLSQRDAEQLAATVANLAAARLPLAAGLRAAADESIGRLSSGLRRLADELERGQTLELAFEAGRDWLPTHVRGMVSAAARTGQLGTALDELLQHQRTMRSMFWRIWGSLAYPLTVAILNVLVIGLLMVYVVPVFKRMFLDFELQLPWATTAVIRVSDGIVWMVSEVGGGLFALCLTVMVLLGYFAATGRGGVVVQRLVIESIPIVGVLWQWSGAASFLYLLSTLLDKNVPLAEALQLTAAGTVKSDLRQAGGWLSAETAKGRSLADLVESSACLPASAAPILRWGERTNSLPEATRILSTMFADRVRMRSDWLRSVAPPFVYVLVGLSAAAVVIALYTPLAIMIQGLS